MGLGDYPDGAWFIELAPISDPRHVPQALASVLQVKDDGGRPLIEAIVDYARTKQMLIVLDNCEHVVRACADLAHRLLESCAGVRVLATSREALGIPGEAVFLLQALTAPAPPGGMAPPISASAASQIDAVRLFVDRAGAVRPDFTLTDANAPAVADICWQLDGLPLAIELAAARVTVLSPPQILLRLKDRFQFLTGGGRIALPRQQTLRAAIDWSYDMLTEPERAVLRRLSVFAGGCTLAAAEAVATGVKVDASRVLDLLSNLVNKSLVIARNGTAEMRFHLLQTIRQYADARLREANESEQGRDDHLGHFLQFARTAEPRLRNAGQGEWLRRLESEGDNLRAALEWACSAGRTAAGLELARCIGRLWHLRGDYAEGRYWLQRVRQLPMAPNHPADLAWVLCFEGLLAWFQSGAAVSQVYIEQSLGVARASENRLAAAYALDFLGMCATALGDFDLAESRFAECQPTFHLEGDRWGTAFSLWHLGMCREAQNDGVGAMVLWEEALALVKQLVH